MLRKGLAETPIYLTAPSTRRSPRFLSRAYGFSGPDAMAESLPEDAMVADFGAGHSKLGRAMTERRPDVKWCNVDLRTGLFHFAQRQQRGSPPGLQYLKADVLAPPFSAKSLDRVYSSWLLPHVWLESEALALQAVHSVASLLKTEGELSVLGDSKKAFSVAAAEYYISPDEVAQCVVEASKLGPMDAGTQLANNGMRFMLGLHKLP